MAQVKSKNMGKDMSLCVIACSYKKNQKSFTFLHYLFCLAKFVMMGSLFHKLDENA